MDEQNGVNPVEGAAQPAANEEQISKIVARRLAESREQMAVALGFESWDAAMNSGYDKKLLDAGIDPKVGKPIIDDLVANHPEVQSAKAILAEAKQQKADAELLALNTKFGLNIESVDKLDDETKKLMTQGIPLSRAYAAVHYDELQGIPQQVDTRAQTAMAKTHVTPVPGTGAPAPATVVGVSAADIANVKRFMPNATDESIREFLKAHPEIKH